MTKIDMKKINRVFRKITGRKTSGVKLAEKTIAIINHYGEEMPVTKREKVDLASQLLSGFNKAGNEKLNPPKVEKVTQPKKAAAKSTIKKKSSNAFYASWEWKKVRYEAIKKYEQRCMCCGWRVGDTEYGYLVVDHIKPRSKYPALALDVNNLQILCNDCNMGKSNDSIDDWRDMDEQFKSVTRT